MKKEKLSKFLWPVILGALFYIGQINTAMAAETDNAVNLQKPWTNLAAQYPNAYFNMANGASLSPQVLAEWWKVFDDPVLTQLITMTLEDNQDLKAAQSRVNQARAQLGISKAKLLPWLDGSGSWTRTQVSDNAPYKLMSGIHNDGKLGIDASWEIDVFGRQKANVRVAANTLQAEHARLYSTWTSLSAETAINYISLRTLQEKLAIAEKQLDLQQQRKELVESKCQAGLIAALPVQQTDYTMRQTEAQIPQLRTSIEETMNRLAILTGNTPGDLEPLLMESHANPEVNANIYFAIPAEALQQRPDIQAAERDLAAQLQRTKAAKAEMKPRISLFGSIGLESISTGSLLEAGSRGFSFGPTISLPIFHAGEIKKNIQVQTEKEKECLAVYEKTVLEAVGETRNALTAGAQEHERRLSLQAGCSSAEDALNLADNNYKSGIAEYSDVLDAQRNLYSLQEDYAASKGQELIDMVQLFKAMGGGWQPMQQLEGQQSKAAAEKN